jgi:hypothetical protein
MPGKRLCVAVEASFQVKSSYPDWRTDMMSSRFRRITEADREPVLAMLKRAFASDPLIRWIYHEDERYQQKFDRFFYAYTGDCFKHGSGLTYLDGRGGVVIWHPPEEPCDYENLWAVFRSTATESRKEDVVSVFKEFAELHPSTPHVYMTFAARDSLLERSTTPLLGALFKHCDLEGMALCGEATSPINVQYYEGFGGKILGEVHRGTSPKYYTMLRTPQATRCQLDAAFVEESSLLPGSCPKVAT